MKRRTATQARQVVGDSREQLTAVLAAMNDPADIDALLTDLCTPSEIEALADRWAVVPLLADGRSYRAIHQETGVSVTTVGRVARCLEDGSGGYRTALRHLDGLASA
ncbi:YerC/YecD family TrpR-related protein [Kytococcus sp. Marseille-QA3725]